MGITLKLVQAQTSYLKLRKSPHLQSIDKKQIGSQGSDLCSEHEEESLINQEPLQCTF